MFSRASSFNQDLSGWCVQDNFNSKPQDFNSDANIDWVNDPIKQPDWDGAACPP